MSDQEIAAAQTSLARVQDSRRKARHLHYAGIPACALRPKLPRSYAQRHRESSQAECAPTFQALVDAAKGEDKKDIVLNGDLELHGGQTALS